MSNFCGNCGSRLDPNTGLCPKCDIRQNGRSGKRNIPNVMVLSLLLLCIICVCLYIKGDFLHKSNVSEIESGTIDSVSETEHSAFEYVNKKTEKAESIIAKETVPIETTRYAPPFTYLEETGAQHVIVDQWNGGGIRLNIYDESWIGVDLQADFFNGPETRNRWKSIVVRLYHSLNENGCYNISFEYSSGKLNASVVYLENGNTEYSYAPGTFQWSEEGNEVHLAFKAANESSWNMFELESVHVVYLAPDESSEEVLSYKMPLACTEVQFNHFEGFDESNDRTDVEKAVIIGRNIAGEVMWIHESDVKYEIYQSSRVASIGYINDKYYYTDDKTVVILDACTGKVLKRVENVGFDPTDAYVDFDGTLYLCCYMGPHFMELSPDGKLEHVIDNFGETCDWAHDVYKDGNYAYVACELGPDPYRAEDYIFEINLSDYSYRLTNPDK